MTPGTLLADTRSARTRGPGTCAPAGGRTRSASSCSRVGSGFGLDFEPLGLPLGLGPSASGPPARYSRHQCSRWCDARDPVHGHDLRLGQTVLDVVARRGDLRLPTYTV